MPDVGATSAKTPQVSPEMQDAIDEAAKKKPDALPPAAPEMQAAIDAIGKEKPYVDRPPTPEQAGMMGLSGSDVGGVAPEELEKTGHVVPTVSTGDTIPPASVAAALAPAVVKSAVTPPGPVVGQAAPTVKDTVSQIIADHAKTSPPGESWQDFLKGAVGKVGEFLQRWGLNEQGAPGVQTHGEIQQAQQFELKKAQAQAEIQTRMAAVENQYQMQRMQLQQEMNKENMTAQGKLDLQNRLDELEKMHQNSLDEINAQFGLQQKSRQWQPGAIPGNFWQGK